MINSHAFYRTELMSHMVIAEGGVEPTTIAMKELCPTIRLCDHIKRQNTQPYAQVVPMVWLDFCRFGKRNALRTGRTSSVTFIALNPTGFGTLFRVFCVLKRNLIVFVCIPT